MRYLLLTVLLLIVAGCGGADRLDASDGDAVKTSKARMTAKMTAEQKAQFEADCQTMVAMKAADFHGRRKPGPPDASLFLKDIDGYTVAQIHDAAEAARAEIKSKQAASRKK